MKYLKSACWLLCFIILLPPAPCTATPSAAIPLDSWIYAALDKLAGLGLVEDSLQGSRPYSRLEAARQTMAAREKLTPDASPPMAAELLRRLEAEFSEELARENPGKGVLPRFNLTEGPDGPTFIDGTVHIPYLLTNRGDLKGNFELKASASTSRLQIFADADGNGLPDSAKALEETGPLAPGESFRFVVSAPRFSSGNPFAARTATVSASAIPASKSFFGFTPLREVRLSWIYRDGEDALFPGTSARQFPLNTNNFGIEYGEDHNAQAVFESELRLGRFFLVNARPLLAYREAGGDSVRLLEGKAALGLGPLELSAGRQSLWWGQGRHGSLVLSSNAKPLDMARLTNPSPAVLPWILKYLGPFRFDLFVSRLEDDRVVPEPYFSGLRVNFKPASWFEFGASRTVIFGGEGRPSVDFEDFLTIVGGENLGGDEDTSNQLAAIDARLKLPFLLGAELYGEYGGEDQADLLGVIPFFSKKALLAGLYLPRIEPSGRLDLRLEVADLNFEDHGPTWYRHSIYRSGYTYEGRILGHHAGGDSKDYYVELRAFLPRGITLAFAFDVQRRGDSLPVREKHEMPSVEAQWEFTPGATLHARYARDRVENFAFVEGEDRTMHFAEAGVAFSW